MNPGDPVAAVRAALHERVEPQARVVLGVSGGPDSVGMAELVIAARPDLEAVVVHVRHGLRSDDHGDAEVAGAHARRLGLECHVVEVTVGEGAGPEDAARRARLTALGDSAAELRAGHVLLGHTADDQAETVLLNIARGTGLRGVAGMPAVRRLRPGVAVLRPVLGLRRQTVRAVAQASGLPLVDDPSNAEPGQRRARARHDVLPRLSTLTGGATDPVVSLVRLAAHARRDADALDAQADQHVRTLVATWGQVRSVPTAELDRLAPAIVTRVVQAMVAAAQRALHPPAEATVAAVMGLREGAAVDLAGGVVATRGGGRLAVAPQQLPGLETRSGATVVDVPELGLVLRCDTDKRPGVLPPWAPPRAAPAISVGSVETFTVRSRLSGDRVRTAAGHQTLADAMASAGVPRLARNLVPVVEDGEGILWVPGVAVRASASGARCLRLEPAK